MKLGSQVQQNAPVAGLNPQMLDYNITLYVSISEVSKFQTKEQFAKMKQTAASFADEEWWEWFKSLPQHVSCEMM